MHIAPHAHESRPVCTPTALLGAVALLVLGPAAVGAGPPTAATDRPAGTAHLAAPLGVEEVIVVYRERSRASFPAGSTVEIWAGDVASLAASGSPLRLVLVGPGTSTASTLELVTETGGVLPGSALGIVDRSPPTPFLSERVTVEVTLNADLTPGGRYRIRVRFPTGETETVPVRIYESGRVTEVEHTGGALRYGVSADFTFRGAQLGNASLDVEFLRQEAGIRLEDVQVLARGPDAATFRATLRTPGHVELPAAALYDGNQPTPPNPSDGARRYRSSGDPDGPGWRVELAPIVQTVTPDVVSRGQRVTLAGIGLDPASYRWSDGSVAPLVPRLLFPAGNGSSAFTQPSERRADALVYPVPDDATSGPLALSYADPAGSEIGRFPLDGAITVNLPPSPDRVRNLTTGEVAETDRPASWPLRVHREDRLRIEGADLTAPGGSLPTVLLGSRQLSIVDSGEGASASTQRIDVSVPVADELAEATLRIETTAGAWESPALLLVPPPVLTGPLRMSEFDLALGAPTERTYRDVTDGRLYRNRSYTIAGRNLNGGPLGEPLRGATLEVAGYVLDPEQFGLSLEDDSVRFALYGDDLEPTAPLGSGPLVYRHAGGETSLGMVRIVDPPPPLDRIVLDADSVVGGETLGGRVLFAGGGGVPDGEWVYASVDPTGPASVGPREPAVGGEVPLAIRTRRVEEPLTVLLQVRKDGLERHADFRIVPRPAPKPVALAFDHRSVVGGNLVSATIELDRPGEGVEVTLESSDPTLLDIPTSVVADGRTVTVQGRTGRVERAATVRLTASSGGASAESELGVGPPRVVLSDLRIPGKSFVTPATVQAEIRVANQGADDPPLEVELRTSPGIRAPRSVAVEGGLAVVRLVLEAVPEATRASVQARSRFGEAAASFVLEPLRLGSLSLPARFEIGVSLSARLTVETPVDQDVELRLEARDPAVLELPSTVVLPRGRTEVEFPVRVRAVGTTAVDVYLATSKVPLATLEAVAGGR